MEKQKNQSWQLLMHASCELREYALADIGGVMEGITIAQQRVIAIVFAHPDGVMPKDIARELDLTPGAVSQTIDHLVREGVLTRTVSELDRRAVVIRASEESLRRRDRVERKFGRVMESVLRQVSPEEREAFLKILKLVIAETGDRRDASARGARAISHVWRS